MTIFLMIGRIYCQVRPMRRSTRATRRVGAYEANVEEETAAHIKRAALLSTEHVRFMAWLVEKGK